MATVQFSKPKGEFSSTLRNAVDSYFSEKKIRKSGNARLYSKTTFIIVFYIAAYTLGLILGNGTPWLGVLFFFILGFAQSLVGFNIMHDACHDAFSSRKGVNYFFGLSMNALGTDAHMWKQKHNIVHHTYTNVDGIDDDIAKSPLMRMSPTQPKKWAHRFQHIYMNILYSISTIYWLLFKDFQEYFFGSRFNVETAKMSISTHFIFWTCKIIYVFLYIFLPIYIMGVGPGILAFVAMQVVLGCVMSFTFQLAHVVENVGFEEHHHGNETMIDNEWLVHQINTTSDFAPNNKFVTWFVGGLNFQVEHHLFPRISHIHYPAIQKIVKKTCEDFGVKYNFYPTTRAALASHFRHMRNLGRK